MLRRTRQKLRKVNTRRWFVGMTFHFEARGHDFSAGPPVCDALSAVACPCAPTSAGAHAP